MIKSLFNYDNSHVDSFQNDLNILNHTFFKEENHFFLINRFK